MKVLESRRRTAQPRQIRKKNSKEARKKAPRARRARNYSKTKTSKAALTKRAAFD